MTLTYLNAQTKSAVLDANGNATIAVGPDGTSQYWLPVLTRVSTLSPQSATVNPPIKSLVPYCAVYLGTPGTTNPTAFIDDTYTGDSDASSIISGTVIPFGQTILANFLAGTPGDTAILTVYGFSSDTPPTTTDLGTLPPGTHFAGKQNIQSAAKNYLFIGSSSTSVSVTYTIGYVGNKNALFVWAQAVINPSRVHLAFYGGTDYNQSFIDSYDIDMQNGDFAKQPVPILGPYLKITVTPGPSTPIVYSLRVSAQPQFGYYNGFQETQNEISQVAVAIAATTTTDVESPLVLEGPAVWTGNVANNNFTMYLIALDKDGNTYFRDQFNGTTPIFPSRPVWLPPMHIRIRVVNQAGTPSTFWCYLTRKWN